MSIKTNSGTFIKNSLMLLVLILLLTIWTKPTWKTIKTISQNLNTQAENLNKVPAPSWPSLNNYLTDQEQQLTTINNLFHTKGQELAFFARLESLAEAEQLKVKLSINENGPAIIPKAETLVMAVETQGNKTAVLRFLQRLEKEPGLVLAQTSLSASAEDTLTLQVTIQSFWRS
ncbi:MAG: hypothetical protein NTV81_02660 [Candidatus Komeilibacteria bacterium]|nr:hypothetical protein [Candidatus Komeilibacteria bacterium]